MFRNLKRLSLDILIFTILIILYSTEFYTYLSQPLQLVSLKVLLVSMGFIHAHITRKLAFGNINWDDNINGKTLLAILLYVLFIYAYATGG